MKYKIGIFTELVLKENKIVDDEPNMRSDMLLYKIMDGTIINYDNPTTKSYDVYFYVIPKLKKKLPSVFKVIKKNMKDNKKSLHIYYQEGPVNYFQEWTIPLQKTYLSVLKKFDLIYTHNQSDVLFYRGITDKYVKNLFTPVDFDFIEKYREKREIENPERIIIGGNFTRWYNGTISTMACIPMDIPISIPLMGRRQKNEESFHKNIIQLPYMAYCDWIRILSMHRYAIHLMPTYAAGSFHIACAALGIPCVGSHIVDTQRLCFPDLSIESTQLETARILLLRLQKDKKFYKQCQETALKNVKYFGRDKVHDTIEKDIGAILNVNKR